MCGGGSGEVTPTKSKPSSSAFCLSSNVSASGAGVCDPLRGLPSSMSWIIAGGADLWSRRGRLSENSAPKYLACHPEGAERPKDHVSPWAQKGVDLRSPPTTPPRINSDFRSREEEAKSVGSNGP